MKILLSTFFLLFSVGLLRAQSAYEIQGNYLQVPFPIEFETGTAKLKKESDPALEYVKAYLTEKTYVSHMRIEGHTDNAGEEAANQQLSEKRALAIGRWLIGHGVDCQRILCTGFGSSKPIQSNATPEGRAANRRIQFVHAGLRGRAIGGMPMDGGGKLAGDVCR